MEKTDMKKLSGTLVAITLLLFGNLSVSAQNQAPKPIFKEGDTWQFNDTRSNVGASTGVLVWTLRDRLAVITKLMWTWCGKNISIDSPQSAPVSYLIGNVSMVFRKHLKDSDGEWHFRPDCPRWPKVNYHEVERLQDDDHICDECIRLQANFSPAPLMRET